MEPCDFGIPDSDLMEMSIADRNALLDEVNRSFTVTPVPEPDCAVTKGNHDWSREDAGNPDRPRIVTVCVACGMYYEDWLHSIC